MRLAEIESESQAHQAGSGARSNNPDHVDSEAP